MMLDLRGPWHAHVYFDADTAGPAWALREAVAAAFEVTLGPWNDRPVGPHPGWSYEIGFHSDLLGALLPWLIQARGALTIFMHPYTGDDLTDHTQHVIWLGPSVALNLDCFTDTPESP
jgi:aromatic ring-cleaving dioxygenase